MNKNGRIRNVEQIYPEKKILCHYDGAVDKSSDLIGQSDDPVTSKIGF